MRARILAVMLLAGSASGLPCESVAAWLVSTDGSRIETRGKPTLEGDRVLFTRANGTLSSIRLEELDLEASRAVNRKRPGDVRRSETPNPVRKKAVFVLTDRDVRHVNSKTETPVVDDRPTPPPAPALGLGEEVPAAAGSADRIPSQGLGLRWRQVDDPEVGGLVIEGEIVNEGGERREELALTVTLNPQEPAEKFSVNALLGASTLAPGSQTRFRAEFPGFVSFTSLGFSTHSSS